jgi:hypothetical protein
LRTDLPFGVADWDLRHCPSRTHQPQAEADIKRARPEPAGSRPPHRRPAEEFKVKKLFMLIAALALALGMTSVAYAADEELPHSGRVLFVAGGDIEVDADEQADAVIVINGDARIAGTVNSLVVVDGTATVTGGTLEGVAIINGTLNLEAGTTVLGDVGQLGSDVSQAEGVEIGGSVNDLAGDVAGFGVFLGFTALAVWIGVGIATLIVGLLMAGLAARQTRSATTLIRQEPGKTFLVGLLAVVVPPILAVLAMATIVGIPAGLGLLIVVWPLVAFIGYVVAAIWLGEWLLGRRDGARAERPYLAATVGLIIAFVIGLIPLVTAVLSIFGLGAVVLAAWRTLRGAPTITRPATQAAAA